jgi:hypothetical protein
VNCADSFQIVPADRASSISLLCRVEGPRAKKGSPQDQSVRVADKMPTFRLAAALTCRCKIG